jgi:lambda family phage minor tail protein L
MLKAQANTSIKNLYSETFSLNPSALISLFEIDVGQIGLDLAKISQTEVDRQINTIFRFHNNVSLTSSSIFWKGKEYTAAPIQAEGFETNAKGTLPTPRLTMTVSDEGIPQLAIFKNRLLELGDITGGKVTRIRTFAKFLDASNFIDSVSPEGFSPDSNSEFPRDIYFIDRKSAENKNTIEFELASILDVEGVKLPGRLVVSNSCPFTYRGAGCLYEYSSRRNPIIHEEEGVSILPEIAPPVATDKDEYISSLLSGATFTDLGEYDANRIYNSGDYVFLDYNNHKYYFVSKTNNVSTSPPNLNYWIPEQCGKSTYSCSMRWGTQGVADGNGIVLGNLPFGGWPTVNRFR